MPLSARWRTVADQVNTKLKAGHRSHVAERSRRPALLESSFIRQELTRRAVRHPVANGIKVGLVSRRLASGAISAQHIDRVIRSHDATCLIDPEGRRNISDVVQACDRQVGVQECYVRWPRRLNPRFDDITPAGV